MRQIIYILLIALLVSGCSINTALIDDESKQNYNYYAIEKNFSKDGRSKLYKLNLTSNKWEVLSVLKDDNITVVDDKNNSAQFNIISKDLIALKNRESNMKLAQQVRNIIHKNLKYPDVARRRDIQGKVSVYFEILPNKKGVDVSVLEYEDVYLKDYTEKFFKSIQNQFPECNEKQVFTMKIYYELLKEEKNKITSH